MEQGNIFQIVSFGQMANKHLQGLYGITSQAMLLNNTLLFQHVEHALKGGMSILQYRNKHVPRRQSIDDLIRLKQLCQRYNALFIINDHIELCAEINAHGVHLGKDDMDIASARRLLGQDTIIGVSCYNKLTLATQASEQGASYIALGAFYASPTKPHAPVASLDLITQVKKLKLPICCIGGITANNAPPLIKSGTDMIAIISDLFNAHSIQLKAQKLTHCFNKN